MHHLTGARWTKPPQYDEMMRVCSGMPGAQIGQSCAERAKKEGWANLSDDEAEKKLKELKKEKAEREREEGELRKREIERWSKPGVDCRGNIGCLRTKAAAERRRKAAGRGGGWGGPRAQGQARR